MSDSPAMVKLMTAKNNMDAKIIAALLESAGIPTFVPGQSLQDEFAMAQNIMGVGAVDIMVPPAALEDAKQIVEEARAAADSIPDSSDEESDDP